MQAALTSSLLVESLHNTSITWMFVYASQIEMLTAFNSQYVGI